jgi:hypothetical protein
MRFPSEEPTPADEIKELRLVVKDLCFIVNELVQLEPMVDETYAATLRDHLDSLGWDNEDV